MQKTSVIIYLNIIKIKKYFNTNKKSLPWFKIPTTNSFYILIHHPPTRRVVSMCRILHKRLIIKLRPFRLFFMPWVNACDLYTEQLKWRFFTGATLAVTFHQSAFIRARHLALHHKRPPFIRAQFLLLTSQTPFFDPVTHICGHDSAITVTVL